jgi:hypothetical protein
MKNWHKGAMSMKRFGVCVAAMAFLAAAPNLAAQKRPFKWSRIEKLKGTRNGNVCRVTTGGTVPRGGNGALAGRHISGPSFLSETSCEVEFEIGEPDDLDVREEQERIAREKTARGRTELSAEGLTSATVEIPESGGNGKKTADKRFVICDSVGHVTARYEDIVGLKVNDVRSGVSWTSDGFNTVYAASGSCTATWLSLTGWGNTYAQCWMQPESFPSGYAATRAHYNFVNAGFCGSTLVGTQYNTSDAIGNGNGTITGIVSMSTWESPNDPLCPNLSGSWIALCDSGSCR